MTTGTCYPSQTDFRLIKTYLKSNGWILSKKIENAALIIIYTCAFIKDREDLSIKYIRKAQKEKNRAAQIIVAGCLPAINKFRLKRIFKGGIVEARSIQEFDKVLNARVGIRDIKYLELSRKLKNNAAVEYYLRIGWGCHGKCSYCGVRFVFGKPHSRPVSDILQEFNIAYGKGYRKYILIANDVGSYGEDLDTSFIHLIRKLCQKYRDCQFALSHLNPDKLREILPFIKNLIRSGRIWRLNIPVESGSNRIIRLMNRSYTANDFKYCVAKLISYNPGIEIKTDIIIGFPTETKRDFFDTLRLVEWLGRNKVYFQCLVYSKRPKTEASKMSGQIEQKVKEGRLKQIERLCRISYVLRDKKLFKKIRRKEAFYTKKSLSKFRY
ncbi:MAG: radical SAM protein [Candidatus Omnitrophica bacterium]|nr:radical SAM protein [Candidatus Omnitrophota bacterium]